MSAGDGSVIGLTKIIDRGPATSKWNLVLVSDGYTAGQLPQFHTDCQDFVDYLFAIDPFDERDVQCAINVYRLDVSSNESSADNPAACGDGDIPMGTTVATYFNATFCGDGQIRRLLVVDQSLVIDTVDDHVPEWDQIIVIVNSTLYGGAGGTVATTSLAGTWENIAVHELGHAAFGLADEYEYYVGCGLETDRNNHPAAEPSEPNVTLNNDPATIKWLARVTDNPMKTSNNPNCSTCDPTANPFTATTVGAFEGAHYYHCDAYRPGWDCMMRNFGTFCGVCQQVIRDTLAPFNTPTVLNLATPTINFNDVPEGVQTARAVVFDVASCVNETFTIIAGPTVNSGPAGTVLGTPLGLQVVSPPAAGTRQARLWITYTGTADGDTATGEVTVRHDRTAQQWVVAIVANTISRPTVAVVLVLDKSGSMAADAGDGRTREQVLRDSAQPFVNVIQADNGIGVVAFDHDATTVMPIQTVGDLNFGVGRSTARTAVANHTLNPLGLTAIGDGIELARTMLNAAVGFHHKAMIVLTDGYDTDHLTVDEVAPGVIDQRVFAIGLGRPDEIRATALTTLADGTGGSMVVTGAIDVDDQFRLAKYYLQILAGVVNADIVTDPDSMILPGQVHRVPIGLTETDIDADVVMLPGLPGLLDFALETPTGQVVTPGVAAGSGIQFSQSQRSSQYRVVLPAFVGGMSEGPGQWHALISLDKKKWDKRWTWLREYGIDPQTIGNAQGVKYTVGAYSFTNLRMRATATQSSFVPGASVALRAVLTEYGIPIDRRASVLVEVTRPDLTSTVIHLVETEPGIFEAPTTAAQQGVHRYRFIGEGTTLRGRPFRREHTATVGVWIGGDQPPDVPGGSGNDGTDWCETIECLLRSGAFSDELIERLRKAGLDLAAVHKCICSRRR